MHRAGLLLAALLLPCCGGLAVIGAFADDDAPPAPRAQPAADQRLADLEPTAAAPASSSSSAAPSPSASRTESVVEKRRVAEREAVPFQTRRVKDGSLAEGTTKVRTKGVRGVRTLTYEVTVTDGEETGRRLVKSAVTKKPVTKVIAVGTKTAGGGGCDPNYSPCVPIASDVDCAGGSGDGPKYVDGPIRIIGGDPYDLDRDGDGVACDS